MSVSCQDVGGKERVVWCGMVWYGMMWCGVLWHGMVCVEKLGISVRGPCSNQNTAFSLLPFFILYFSPLLYSPLSSPSLFIWPAFTSFSSFSSVKRNRCDWSILFLPTKLMGTYIRAYTYVQRLSTWILDCNQKRNFGWMDGWRWIWSAFFARKQIQGIQDPVVQYSSE